MCSVRCLVAFMAAGISIQSFALEPDQVYAKVAPSIVVVVGYKTANPAASSLGSGVVIAPGQIVTNCHVIEDADLIYVRHEKISSVALLRFADPDRDLCQVTAVDKSQFSKAITGVVSVSELRVGQRVYAVGAPQGLDLTLSDGLISSLRTLDEGTVIQTNAPISPGSSGGGLFDANARLIGITSFYHTGGQNLNFAVPASWILELPTRHLERGENKRLDEQRRIEEAKREEQRRIDEARREEERKQHEIAMERERLKQEAARKQDQAGDARQRAEAAARPAQERLVADFVARIKAQVQRRVVLPPNIEGNPQAEFHVVLIPGGEVVSATLRKSSGNSAYDAAVERAIMAAQPLPVPSDPDLFQESFRELVLAFRAKGRESPAFNDQAAIQRDYDSGQSQENSLVATYVQAVSREIKRYQKYPTSAQRRGWEGTAEVLLQIGADGYVTRIDLGKSSGHAVLDEEALNIVRRASPLPQAPLDLRGRALVIAVPIVFGLTKSQTNPVSQEGPLTRSPIAPWISDTPGPGTKFKSRDFSNTKETGPSPGH